MAQGITVMLDEHDSDALRKQVYTIVTNSIEQARRDSGLDRQYLKRKDAAKYAGVSPTTLDNWKLPVHRIDGIVLYSKKDIQAFIESN
ncbi:DNA-binding protein [Companilactobacillus zhachilii]|uniref:DNA-binding protein n=1 Tax=Companilactobacillus zhachilii TaxID=2304606 RepID=A0A386PSI5_9LACO|nr:helix-turn-helix domain-containing protein [Companilactobacillus zhachilii]AYE37799.1 DNA-binding protein [Companilactobacillus zhachilii]